MTEYKLTLKEKIKQFFGLNSNYYNDIHQLHREDGPASIESNGTQEWYLNGKYHREDGPAYIGSDGTQSWWVNDYLHREDGPAVIWADGYQEWYKNGKRHREDDPATIWSDGYQEWWINGRPITEEVNQWFKDCNLTYETMKFEDKMALKFYIRGLV